MEAAAIASARWVVSRALSPVTDGLFESWAASSELGPNARALKTELLCAQAMLDNVRGHDIRSHALGELLLELRQLAYSADDVLDELEYFRIQDKLEGTNDTTDASDRSFVRGLVLNTRHTAKAVASKLKLSCSCASAKNSGSDGDQQNAEHREHTVRVPKLKFDRVEMSKRMKETLEQLKSLTAKIANIPEIKHLGASSSTTQDITLDRPITTPEIIEPKLYGGRDTHKSSIVEKINSGKYSANDLTVLSLVGPGGIGKTTFTQHIYEEAKSHFDVPIWICVSLKFSASRLTQEIVERIPKVKDEPKCGSQGDLIRKRLQYKKFLLVLDDMWECPEDEWKKLLAPFKNVGTKGNMVIVTTRIPKEAKMVASKDCLIRLERLNDEECMHFFHACVFGDQPSWDGHADLKNIGWEIVKKLKGSPLAVKTVGRLLRNNLDRGYWERVLESRDWEHQTKDDDIMPALRLSYNHLPFDLQHCFSYCALFPEDYEFDSKELIHLWIGLGLLGTSYGNKRIEDIGEDYLNGLVNYGFLQKKFKEDVDPHYLVHDLLHDLAVDVSSQECLCMHNSRPLLQNPASIRHLSIAIDNEDVKDRMTFETYKSNLIMLVTRLKAQNLRSLLIFGSHHASFLKTFSDLFREAKALRVIFLSGTSYNVDDLVLNFSKLVHLRYLRIRSDPYLSLPASIPSSISRFYHLLVLDLKNCEFYIDCLREMRNLVKLRHFLVFDYQFHFHIFEVGKLKFLQELRCFEIKKETSGFELKQLGQLLQLQGSLAVYNLETVEEIKEAEEAKLVQKNHLNRLVLDWGTDRSIKDPKKEEDVLECLKPHSNIREVCIRGHGGSTYPTWLCADLYIKNLESLYLDGVAWKSLPPLGGLWMINEHGEEYLGCITDQSFNNLKRVELVNLPKLKKWYGNGTSHIFSNLEVFTVRGCSELVELPFSRSTCHQVEHEQNMARFPSLHTIHISDCPKLLWLPSIPWSHALCNAKISRVGTGIEFSYNEYKWGTSTWVEMGKDAADSELWNMLGFSNLSETDTFGITECPPVPPNLLQMLTSLKTLYISNCSNVLWQDEGVNNCSYVFQVEKLKITSCGATGEELTKFLSYFPKLSELILDKCEKVTSLGVEDNKAAATPEPPLASIDNSEEAARIEHNHHQVREEEIETTEGGLLLLPPHIQELTIYNCHDLRLCCPSWDSSTATVRGLHGLSSLRSLNIDGCPNFLSSSSPTSSYSTFPASLQSLTLRGMEGTLMLAPLPNLKKLILDGCGDLIGDNLWHLLAQGHLITLCIFTRANKLSTCDIEPSWLYEQDHCNSFRLQELRTDDIARTLAPFPFARISSFLTILAFYNDNNMKFFTKDQEEALQTLTSLQEFQISFCEKLQVLPSGLGALPNLKRLDISYCESIRSWPKDGFPGSLRELRISDCPALEPLPEGSLPWSLQKLDSCDNNESLMRQCHELRGTIPIIDVKTIPSTVQISGGYYKGLKL